MPLVLQMLVVWAGGTALGLLGVGVASATALGFGLGVWLLWRGIAAAGPPRAPAPRSPWAALALLGAAALLTGADLAAGDATCAEHLRRARQWTVRLARNAEPSAFVTGTILADGCRVPVALSVRQGEAAAGSLVQVRRAEVSSGERGLLLREAVLGVAQPPSPLWRWRNRVARSIERRFGADAGMAKALLIADTRGLSPELRERYADAGLVHILSISGLHVGIIGAALLLAVEALRAPATLGRVAAVALVALYVLAIGAPAAAVRSAGLFAAVTMTRLLQRPTSPWATYAVAAAVPLVEPRTVLDLGWQLSVGGYAALIGAGRLARRVLPATWRGWRRHVGREVLTGLLTTAATAPLVAWHFGRISLVAVVSNLGAAPVVAVLQPTLFLAMLAPGDAIGGFVADAARPMLRALDAVAATAAAVPGAAVAVAPTALTVAAGLVAAVALIAAAWSRHWAPKATLALGALACIAWIGDRPLRREARLEVHLLDVGQGDAVALRTPAGRWILVDAGRAWASGDAGRSTVIPYLRRQGGALALFVLTHPHADHVGGAASVVTALRPSAVRDAAFVAASPFYADFLAATRRVGAHWARVRPGEALALDGVRLEFLAPDSAWTVALDDPNEASTILRVTFGARSLLLTGDAELALEEWLLRHARDRLDADILKVAHHGSSTSSTGAFLEAVTPRVALVSVGRDNSYGHPSPAVMQRLLNAGATVLRTDQLGTVVLRTDGRTWEAAAAGHRWPVALPPAPLP
jgi:competence protein ComEC